MSQDILLDYTEKTPVIWVKAVLFKKLGSIMKINKIAHINKLCGIADRLSGRYGVGASS